MRGEPLPTLLDEYVVCNVSRTGHQLVRHRMTDEPTTCPSCGTWVAPTADGSCPSCLRSIAEERSRQERHFKEQIEAFPIAVTEPFVFPSLKRKQIENAVRQANRAVWLKRATIALAVAIGAVLGKTALGIAEGLPAMTNVVRACDTLLYGLIVAPLSIFAARCGLIVLLARYESAQSDPDDLLIELLVRPWPWCRFLVWAGPAFFRRVGLDRRKVVVAMRCRNCCRSGIDCHGYCCLALLSSGNHEPCRSGR